MKKTSLISIILVILMSFALSACQDNNNDVLTASGHLSAIQVSVSPEVNGRVEEIFVREGETVESGDVLFRIDDEILWGQYEQAQAAVETAEATLLAAQAQLEFAQTQLDLATQSARMQEKEKMSVTGIDNESLREDFVPEWYFEKTERIAAAQYELDLAYQGLINERASLKNELDNVSNQDFVEIEEELNNAQAGYLIAKQVYDQVLLTDDDALIDVADVQLGIAEAELDTAQLKYDRVINTNAADAVIDARARLAVSQERYNLAFDALSVLLTGEESLEVALAWSGVKQAEASVSQAEANVEQTHAALKLVELQLDRTMVKAPISGTIMSVNVEAGEVAAAGGVLMTVAKIDPLSLTVYVPADRYGQISLGEMVQIRVDSFPSDEFFGYVEKIANEAVYTPRNVQTADSRSSTVYAVKIHVPNQQLLLKPGMPADVTFIP